MAGKHSKKPPNGAVRCGTIGSLGDGIGAFANVSQQRSLLAIPDHFMEAARALPVYIHPNLGATAGWAGGNWISLNQALFDHPSDLIKTFLHEVAHVITEMRYGRVQAHGYEWRRTCLGLGHNASRTHNYPYLQPKRRPRPIVYACTGCTQEYTQTRPLKHEARRLCHKCRSPITRIK